VLTGVTRDCSTTRSLYTTTELVTATRLARLDDSVTRCCCHYVEISSQTERLLQATFVKQVVGAALFTLAWKRGCRRRTWSIPPHGRGRTRQQT